MSLLLLLRAAAAPPAAISTFTDDFATANSTKWGYGSTDVSVVNSRLRINASPAYPTLASAARYDLTGGRAFVAMTGYPSVAATSNEAYLGVNFGTNNAVEVIWSSNGPGWVFRLKTAGTNSDTFGTVDAVNDLYVGVRESAGTLFWETSPDGATWTVRRSVATPAGFTPASAGVYLQAGNYASLSGQGFVEYDNFGIATRSSAVAFSSASTLGVTAVRSATAAVAFSQSSTFSTAPGATSYATVTALPIPGDQATTLNALLVLPANIPDGSLGLIAVSYNPTSSTTNTITVTPAGWTLLETISASTTSATDYYARTLGPSDSGTTVTVDASSTTGKYTAAGVVLVGVSTTDLSARASLFTNTVSTTHPNPVATGSAPRVAVSIFSTRGSALATDATPPAGFTEQSTVFNTSTGATGLSVATNLTRDDDGSVGGGTWTLDQAQGAMVMTFALSPLTVAGGQPVTGAVAFGQSSSFGVGASVSTSAAVVFGQSSTLAVAPTVTRTAAVAFASSSSMAVTATTLGTSTAAVVFGQSSTLAVAGSLAGTAAVAFGQSSTFSVTASTVRVAAVAFASSSSLAVAGTTLATSTASVAFGQSSTLAVSGAQAGTAAVAFGQSSTLAVSGAQAGTAAVAFGQSSTLAVAGSLAQIATLTFNQTSSLSLVPSVASVSAVAFGQSSSLAVGPALSRSLAVAFVSTSTLAVVPAVSRTVPVAFAQSSSLAVTAAVSRTVPVVFGQSSTLTVVTGGLQSGAVAFVQSSTLTVGTSIVRVAAVAFGQSSTLAVGAVRAQFGAVAFAQSSSFSVAGFRTTTSPVAFASSSVLAVAAVLARLQAVAFASSSTLSVSGTVGRVSILSAVAFVQASTLAVAARVFLPRDLKITGVTEPENAWTTTALLSGWLTTDPQSAGAGSPPESAWETGEVPQRPWETTEPVSTLTTGDVVSPWVMTEPAL